MTCPNCSQETNGLKLNNRLYCTECGFDLSTPKEPEKAAKKEDETPRVNNLKKNPSGAQPMETDSEDPKTAKIQHDQPNPKPKKILPSNDPRPEIISPDGEEFKIESLEAEEEVLDLVEKQAAKLANQHKKLEAKKAIGVKKSEPKIGAPIIKHNRVRTDYKYEGDFELVAGEPDPIAEPEIEPAQKESTLARFGESIAPKNVNSEEAIIEMPKIKHNNELASHGELNEAVITGDDQKNRTGSPLLSYFQKNAASSQSQKKSHSKKSRTTFNKLWLWIAIPIFIILAFISLILYVNLIATNPAHSKSVAEQTATFEHSVPNYVPAGYSLSFETNATKTKINYVYNYQPDQTKILSISAEKTNLTEKSLFDNFIKTKTGNLEYSNSGSTSVWIVGDDHAYFVKNGVLYTITTNNDLPKQELIDIASGLK